MRQSDRYDIRDRNVCRLSHEQRGWMYSHVRANRPPWCKVRYVNRSPGCFREISHRGRVWFLFKDR